MISPQSNLDIQLDIHNLISAEQLKQNTAERINIKLKENYSYIIPKNTSFPKNTFHFRNYKINLFYLHCSCKSYRENVKKYPKRDLRRICKHIYFKIFADYSEALDTLSKLLLDTKYWFGITYITKVDLNDDEIYLGLNFTKEKVAAIINVDECWKQYIYNLRDLNWVGDKPSSPEILEKIFKGIFINMLL